MSQGMIACDFDNVTVLVHNVTVLVHNVTDDVMSTIARDFEK